MVRHKHWVERKRLSVWHTWRSSAVLQCHKPTALLVRLLIMYYQCAVTRAKSPVLRITFSLGYLVGHLQVPSLEPIFWRKLASWIWSGSLVFITFAWYVWPLPVTIHSSSKEDIHFSGVLGKVHAVQLMVSPIFIFLSFTSYVIDTSRILPVAFEKRASIRQAEHNSRSHQDQKI